MPKAAATRDRVLPEPSLWLPQHPIRPRPESASDLGISQQGLIARYHWPDQTSSTDMWGGSEVFPQKSPISYQLLALYHIPAGQRNPRRENKPSQPTRCCHCLAVGERVLLALVEYFPNYMEHLRCFHRAVSVYIIASGRRASAYGLKAWHEPQSGCISMPHFGTRNPT